MVEISLSGSGEALGGGSPRGYSTRFVFLDDRRRTTWLQPLRCEQVKADLSMRRPHFDKHFTMTIPAITAHLNNILRQTEAVAKCKAPTMLEYCRSHVQWGDAMA